MIDITTEEMKTVHSVCTRLRKLYGQYVWFEDFRQELVMWVLEHEDKVREWRDVEWGHKALWTALFRAGRSIGEKEKAYQSGYHPDDLYFYSKKQLRDLLPDAITGTVGTRNDESRAGASPEMYNRETMIVDVRVALSSLPNVSQKILSLAANAGFDYDLLAQEEGISLSAMRMRVDRALTKLQQELGGSNPFHDGPGSRKSISSAHGRYLIHQTTKGDHKRKHRDVGEY